MAMKKTTPATGKTTKATSTPVRNTASQDGSAAPAVVAVRHPLVHAEHCHLAAAGHPRADRSPGL